MNQRITREEIVRIYNIEVTFFDSLEESGLIRTQTEEGIKYLLYEELAGLERFVNWHYDLEVNLAGIEIIHDLLQKMEVLQQQNLQLHRRLSTIPEEE